MYWNNISWFVLTQPISEKIIAFWSASFKICVKMSLLKHMTEHECEQPLGGGNMWSTTSNFAYFKLITFRIKIPKKLCI